MGMTPSAIIDALGGTSEVARLCNVKAPSVSEWRVRGIPPAREMYLRAVRPEVFEAASVNQAESGSEAAA